MIESMSTPGAPAGPSTSMMRPSGFVSGDVHSSSRTTTLSPRFGVRGAGSRSGRT